MPSVLTHDFFGRDVFDTVAAELGFTSKDERDAFILGNQGPDPLLYLVMAPWVKAQNRLGGRMHHEKTPELFVALHDAVDMLNAPERGVARAYAAGFLCHYLLDCTVHPLVFANEFAICDAGIEGLDRSHGTRVHQEIEKDIDEMVLFTKLHETVATYRPYKHCLKASGSVLATIDKLYFYTNLWTFDVTIDLDAFTQGTKSFRRMNRLFWSPGDRKRAAVVAFERSVRKGSYSEFDAMAHRVRRETTSAFDNHEHREWANPFTGEVTTESFWDLYEDAQERVFDTERTFFGEGFDLEAARSLCRGINFDGSLLGEDGMPLGEFAKREAEATEALADEDAEA